VDSCRILWYGIGQKSTREELVFVPLSKERRACAVGLAVLFLALFWLCWLFPLTGDDWFREELGRSIHSIPDLIQAVVTRWQTTNGRILGNVLAYSAGGRKILRELLRSSITLAAVAVVSRHWAKGSLAGLLLSAAALLALPRNMFREIYPWAAGFFNYVPPVVLILAALSLADPVFDDQPIQESRPRAVGIFLLGFCGQLFIENDTLYALCAALALLVWYRWRQKKWSPTLIAFFLGAVLGAALLFTSPSYGLISQSGGYELDLSHGLYGLIITACVNQQTVLTYLLSGCPVVYLSLTGLGLVWFARSERQWPDKLSAAVLILGCACFTVGQMVSLPMWVTPPVVLLWGMSMILGCWRWLPQGGRRTRALFFGLSAVVAAVPLLLVTPIGPRCLYLSYVLLLLAAGQMLAALSPAPFSRKKLTAGAAVALAAVLVFNLWLFLPIHRQEAVRLGALESAMEAQQSTVSIPSFPHGEYLWDADSFKIQYRYYYETPGDLAVTYVPADQWNGAD
jgi:hypothetical protein